MTLPLHYSRYRFVLEAQMPVALGSFPAGVVRAAVGRALRTVSCSTGATTCEGCLLTDSCAYGQLFEGASRPAVLHSGYADAPRPYVLHLPSPLPSQLPVGASLAFDLILIESAATALPLLIEAVRRAGRSGLGGRRRSGWGQARLQRVEAHHLPIPRVVWTPRADVQPIPAPVRLGGTPCPAEPEAGLCLEWETPVRLRVGGRVCHAPTAEDLVRSLVRRVEVLAALHGRLDDALRDQLQRWIEVSLTVPVERSQFKPVVRRRYSARQRRSIPLEGVLGRLTLGPGWTTLWPLLDAGRLLHVGKNTTHGLGQYRLELVSLSEPIPV